MNPPGPFAAGFAILAEALALLAVAPLGAALLCTPSLAGAKTFVHWLDFVGGIAQTSALFGGLVWVLVYPWAIVPLCFAAPRRQAVFRRAALAVGRTRWALVIGSGALALHAIILCLIIPTQRYTSANLQPSSGVAFTGGVGLLAFVCVVVFASGPSRRITRRLCAGFGAAADAIDHRCEACGYPVAPNDVCPECGRLNIREPRLSKPEDTPAWLG